MNAPVAHLARAGIPVPVPVVVPSVPEDRTVGRWPKPQVIIDVGVFGERVFAFADRAAHTEAVDLDSLDLA